MTVPDYNTLILHEPLIREMRNHLYNLIAQNFGSISLVIGHLPKYNAWNLIVHMISNGLNIQVNTHAVNDNILHQAG